MATAGIPCPCMLVMLCHACLGAVRHHTMSWVTCIGGFRRHQPTAPNGYSGVSVEPSPDGCMAVRLWVVARGAQLMCGKYSERAAPTAVAPTAVSGRRVLRARSARLPAWAQQALAAAQRNGGSHVPSAMAMGHVARRQHGRAMQTVAAASPASTAPCHPPPRTQATQRH